MMTLKELNDSLYPKPMAKVQEEMPLTLMLYEAALQHKVSGDWALGQVVTHLSIEDWAELHHYNIISIGNVRPARLGIDLTDLK
jgi:hypothetical protein